jgi:AraC-like DNA-binding protein
MRCQRCKARFGGVASLGGAGSATSTDEHQVVYASRGVLSVTTEIGVWISPATRAIWVPAGVVHHHRAYGPTVLHTIGLSPASNPLDSQRPVVIAVGPLLRELLVAYAALAQDGPRRRRLRAVLLDELRESTERPLHLPSPGDPRLAELFALLQASPDDRRSIVELARAVGTSPRTLARLCRDELGMTFPQWRTQIRIRHALQLLAEGTLVTVVATRCG